MHLALAVAVLLNAAPDAGAPAPKPKPGAKLKAKELVTWPRLRADKLGCLLETRLGLKDPRFNCATRELPKGDPCVNTDAWYAGPAAPATLPGLIDGAPGLEAVRFEWEHGDLQSLLLQFAGERTAKELGALLGLDFPKPKAGDSNLGHLDYPKSFPNLMSVSVQRCSKTATCVLLQGFDHLGAGDADCTSVTDGGR